MSNQDRDIAQIEQIISSYEEAFEAAGAEQMASLFWSGDQRFSEVETHINHPFGEKRYQAILEWILDNQPAGWMMKFQDTKINFLTSSCAFSISNREIDKREEFERSRVTLIYLRKADEWRIIHGHFSRCYMVAFSAGSSTLSWLSKFCRYSSRLDLPDFFFLRFFGGASRTDSRSCNSRTSTWA